MSKPMTFCSLHHHTSFSFLDGHGTPAQHFARAVELGQASMAITDHGNVSGHVQAEKASIKTGVKAIYGVEAYTALNPKSPRKFHLTLLAMDAEGYRNLMRIVSRSWEEFYRWPTVSGALLSEFHEGIIVLSGCLDSLLACSLLGGKDIEEVDASYDRAIGVAQRFREVFGDRFYLECQMFPELKRAHQVNSAYEKMGKRLRIPLVVTADVHTLRPGQGEIRALLHAAGRGSNTIAQQMSGWDYEVNSSLPLSDKEVLSALRGTTLSRSAASAALAATGEIASRCNVVLPKAEPFRYPATREEMKWTKR